MGMKVGFVTFVYVPSPDPPLKNKKQNTNTKQKRSNSTVQHKTNSIPTVWQVMSSPEIK